jgi:lincosamide nucleotidyltransferase A/C/D/E
MMTEDDVTLILDRLGGAGIDVWLDGGWAVDALLEDQTRAHEDLDLIVQVSDVPAMRVTLAGDGFGLDRGETYSNFVLRDRLEREIDVHPVVFDAHGNGHYTMESGADWAYPADGFRGKGRVAGQEVRCLTADVQMLCHATGYTPGETDIHDMRLLNVRLGTPLLPPYDRP